MTDPAPDHHKRATSKIVQTKISSTISGPKNKTNFTRQIIMFVAFAAVIGQAFPPQVISRLSTSLNNLIGASVAQAISYTYVNGYPTWNGNYYDCSGNIDNDMGHHVTNPNDTDSAHHVGLNCGGVSQPANNTPVQPPVTYTPTNSTYTIYTYVNGYPTLNGNYLDCNGNVDNDMGHHVTNPSDTDPGHHVGQNCPNQTEVQPAQPTQTAPSVITPPVNNQPVTDPAPTNSSPTNNSSTGVFNGKKMYVDPNNQATADANAIRSYDSYNASLLDKIGNQPNAVWFGNWNSDVKNDAANLVKAAAAQNSLPVVVVYNIPQRDCGGYSAGSTSSDAYKQWISDLSQGLRGGKAAVILEPDSTALIDCLSSSELRSRNNLLKLAVDDLEAVGQSVYIDAGHPNWISVSDMASRLEQAGVDQADGFALNVSNFTSTSDNLNYGDQLSKALGGKHFIVDTSRNGNGGSSDSQWCNPSGRALGQKPTADTGDSLADAFVWAKLPGGSDGQCNGGPAAGVFWRNYAEDLAARANW